jgi:hypothetical protein
LEWQLNSAVVGQIYTSPVAIVERNSSCGEEIPGLLEVSCPSTPESEVFGWIVRIPEVEAPSEI